MSTHFATRWRQEARDLLELWLLPGLAYVLPWAWCYGLFKRMARWNGLYRAATEQARVQAQARGWFPVATKEQEHWLWQRRLVTLLDHADLFLWLRRGVRGVPGGALRVHGKWSPAGHAAVLCTFHWGTGWWGLAHAVGHLGQAHALVASLDPAHFVGRRVLWRYARLRTRLVGETLQAPAIDAARGLRGMLRVLGQGGAVMAAVDVPADTVEASLQSTVLQRPFRVPRAIFRLACQQHLPVYTYITGVDENNGHRWLQIERIESGDEPELLAQAVFDKLDAAIRQQSAHWHFWSEAPRLFADTVSTPPPQ